jgi:hypothetical protein
MAKQQVINKFTSSAKTRVEADTQAALSVVEMEQNQQKALAFEQEQREKLIAVAHELVGRVQAANLMSKFGDISRLIWLKQVKECKIYKDMPAIKTWENFCNYLGISRRHIDEQLQNLSALGEDFLATCRQFSLGYRDIRKLRLAASDGDIIIDDKCVVIGDEKIPMTPDHSEDLEAAIDAILENRDRKLADQEARLKAKDRILEEKERVINKQEKEIHKMTREIKARGFEPGEENFIKKMENLKTTLIGIGLQLDDRVVMNHPEELTPPMIAAYIETLGHAARIFRAYYDTAATLVGDADLDDTYWTPPQVPDEELGTAETDPCPEGCTQCEFHRALANKNKGVKIPGEHGKCIREGGLCDIKQKSFK